MKTAVKAKKIFIGNDGMPLERHALIFEDELIVDIIPWEVLEAPGMETIETLDYSNKYITPGLIDSHVHLILPGDGSAGHLIAERNNVEVMAIAMKNTAIALRQGITTIRDCGSWPQVVFPLRKTIQSGLIQGPDLILCGAPITPIGGHCHYMYGEVSGAEDVRRMARKHFKMGANFVKMMATGGGTPNTLPNGLMLNLEELKAGVEEAHRWNTIATTHVLTVEGFKNVLEAGMDGIEHGCYNSGSNKFCFRKDIADEVAKKGITVCHTLQVLVNQINSYGKMGNLTIEKQKELDYLLTSHEVALESFRLTYEYTNYIIGSDAGWRQSGYGQMYLGMKMMSECGMNNHAIIHSATGRAADFFRIGDKVGYLKPGAQADFVILSIDPEDTMLAFKDPDAVYKKGQLVTINI